MSVKPTLLEIVQDILSEIDSDEVQSTSDTTEADQVKTLLKRQYNYMLIRENIPEINAIFKFTALGDTSKPNYLQVPNDVKYFTVIRYNVRDADDTQDDYKEIRWEEPEHFIDRVVRRNSGSDNVTTVVDFSGQDLFIYNDQKPTFYTMFDDKHVIFDSYLSSVDSTIQQSKSLGYGSKIPTFPVNDDDVFELDFNLTQELFTKTLSAAFDEIKQLGNPNVAKDYRDLRNVNQFQKWKNNYRADDRNDFGRK